MKPDTGTTEQPGDARKAEAGKTTICRDEPEQAGEIEPGCRYRDSHGVQAVYPPLGWESVADRSGKAQGLPGLLHGLVIFLGDLDDFRFPACGRFGQFVEEDLDTAILSGSTLNVRDKWLIFTLACNRESLWRYA